MTERRWFSAREAGEYFGIPRKSILKYAALGRFPKGSILRLGKHWRFNLQGIEEAMSNFGRRDRGGFGGVLSCDRGPCQLQNKDADDGKG